MISIAVFDAITCLLCTVAISIVIFGRRRLLSYDIRLLLLGLLGFALVSYSAMFLQWSNVVGDWLDPYDDLIRAVVPLWWAFLFYALLQYLDRRDLRESEERFRRLAENAHDMIYRMSLPDGKYEYVSPAASKLFGYAPESWIATPKFVERTIHPQWQEWYQEAWQRLLQGDCPPSREYLILDITGKARWMHERCSLVTDPRGKPIALEGIVTDITEPKQIEEKLRQAQKLEAVGRLAGGVAHDFNNLLQGVLGFAELAMLEVEEGTTLHEDLKQIMSASGRASKLVQQMLAFSRRQVLEFTNLDLVEVVSETGTMLRRIIGEDITLDLIAGAEPVIVRADRGQVEQVLINLSVNARDAMPEGGKLSIAVETVELDEEFCRHKEEIGPGSYAVLRVSDTGSGISPETLRHLFEPFYTTKDVHKGTGLGLATIFGIVRQHNGFIDVHSEVGTGTTFNIYLPLAESPSMTEETQPPDPTSGGTETILLAEDEEVVRDVAQRVLTQAGYTVIQAENGQRAIELFEQHADNIDLVLLDVIMPKLGGRAVYEYIQSTRPDTAVLFASGYGLGDVHQTTALDPQMPCIQKPYGRDTLLRHVRDILDHAKLHTKAR